MGAESQEPGPNALEVLSPPTATVLLSTGWEVQITPIRVRDLGRFVRTIYPAIPDCSDPGVDLLTAFAAHSDALIEATAIGCGMDRKALDDLDGADLLALMEAVVGINADFFERRIAPRVRAMLAKAMIATLTRSGPDGPTSSNA